MSQLAMPICGLKFTDLSEVAWDCGGNRVRTASRLGVAVRSLDAAISRHGLHNWFMAGRGRSPRPRKRCVTREQIIEVVQDGYSQKDAAFLLGIEYSYLKDLVRLWNLREFFPAHGKCVQNGRLGYAR